MASVAIDAVLLSKVSDLATLYTLDVSNFSESDGVSGQVRSYANGRRRSITSAARSKVWKITCEVYADRVTVRALQALKGEVLLARDPYGRKMFGVTYDLDITEVVPVDKVTVTFSLTELTYSEAV